MSKRLAIYTRVSSKDKQGDNFSLPSQLTAMRAYAERHGHTIIAEFSATESASKYGDGMERTELRKVRQLAQTRQIDMLMFYARDRFTRDVADGILLRRELYRLGVELWCYDPAPHQITSDMELMHIMTDYMSEQYIERLREGSMRGYRQAVQQGVWARGRAPYGYRIEGNKASKGKQSDRHLVIDEETARTVRLIFQWFVEENLSTTQIVHRLTELRAPTPGEVSRSTVRRRAPGVWSVASTWLILRNEVYAGTWHACTRQANGKGRTVPRGREHWIAMDVPKIVDRATWETAQRRLTERDYERRAQYKPRREYLLSRRIRCVCGTAMHGITRAGANNTELRYYRCMSYNSARGHCGALHFRADQVEAVIWRFISELVRDPARLLRGYRDAQVLGNTRQAAVREQMALVDGEIADYRQRLGETLDQRERAKVRTLQDVLDERAEQYAGIIEELEARREQLAAQLTHETISDGYIQSIVEFTADMRDELDDIEQSGDEHAKRAILELLRIRTTLRMDAAGERWVDIQWLEQDHSRSLSALLDLPAPA